MKICPGKWIFLLPLFFIAACGRPLAPLTEQEKHNVSQLTENLETHCVGRYLIDMPAGTRVSGGAKVQRVTIDSEVMSYEAYRQEISSRQSELKGKKSIDAYPFLYADDEMSGQDAHYFIHRGSVNSGPGRRVMEAYKWDHGYRFKLGVDGYDYLHPDQTYKPSIQALRIKNSVPENKNVIFDLVKRLRWRDTDEIPVEPGICFLGAFLPGKTIDKESAWAQFVLAQNLDVSIAFGSDSDTQESNTLLQRSDQINADLKVIGGRAIRKGAVALPGIDAEEWIFTGKTTSGVQGTRCLLEANSLTSSAKSPLLTLDLDSGSTNAFIQDEIKAASMSEGEAVALWDVISRTLRPRPHAF